MRPRRLVPALLALVLAAGSSVAQPGTKEQRVTAPTRLDWELASRGFGADAARLPAGFDSTKQRYQLYVPKNYQKKQAWPLVLFISAGEGPMGWPAWQKLCEREGIFFASPYGAGNATPAGPRTRIILDVLDDVRRAYNIDPDRTYLTGFSGGGRMACSVAFALPELFGGVAPLCGTNPIAGPTYLRHRVEDRLSVALITGEKDFNRKENEVYLGPWLRELGVRSRLWVVPKVGHIIPAPDVQQEVYAWLEAGRSARAADGLHAKLLAAEEASSPTERGRQLLAAADAELKQPARVWRGVTLVQGVAQRAGSTDAGKKARQLLQSIAGDEKLLALVAEQGAADEQKAVAAQAGAFERFGQPAKAIEAWQILEKNYEGTPVGRNAQDQVRRLQKK